MNSIGNRKAPGKALTGQALRQLLPEADEVARRMADALWRFYRGRCYQAIAARRADREIDGALHRIVLTLSQFVAARPDAKPHR